jgi:hypothetical protein
MQFSKSWLFAPSFVAFLAAPAAAQTFGPFISFDPSGSTGTTVTSINATGAVVGYFYDYYNQCHGFVRDPAGGVTTFDAPGSTCTSPESINRAGYITGSYEDSSQHYYGFVRDPAGPITEFDPAGNLYVMVTALNSKGTVAGYDSSGGFLRYPSGSIFSITGLSPFAINDYGVATGSDSGSQKGFVRSQNGQTILFSGAPGSMYTTGTSINDSGTIAGYYELDGFYFPFVRDVGGIITTFWSNIGTQPAPFINAQGYVGASWCDMLAGHCEWYGLLRKPDGAVLLYIRFPGSVFTVLSGMNATGEIAGSYVDTQNVTHGFVTQLQPASP